MREYITRDYPDDCQSGVNICVFPSFLQDRREVQTATGTFGQPETKLDRNHQDERSESGTRVHELRLQLVPDRRIGAASRLLPQLGRPFLAS